MMNQLLSRLLVRPRAKWWQLRHKVYFYEVSVPPPVSPTGGDDTAMIQDAINEAGRTPEWFTELYQAYQQKWYRVFLKRPVLRASARLQAGIYEIGTPLVIGDNIHIEGQR